MRAISLWQPWATFLVMGLKKTETRHWSTKFRGPLLIHASQTNAGMRNKSLFAMAEKLCENSAHKVPVKFMFGGYVGIVNVVDCKRIEDIKPDSLDWLLGNWGENRFGWICENPVAFKNIVPAKGKQGFWTVSDTELASIQEMGNR